MQKQAQKGSNNSIRFWGTNNKTIGETFDLIVAICFFIILGYIFHLYNVIILLSLLVLFII